MNNVARELLGMAKQLVSMDFPTQDAMDKYLKEHPDADKSNHRVVKQDPSNMDTHPMNLMRQRKNEKRLQEIGKHFKKDPKDLTNDDIERFNKRGSATQLTDRNAAAGMPQSAFRAKVYRIMQKIARKYGGTASGMVAAGELGDGATWSVTISRHNASNGETFGRLDLTVTRNGRTEKFGGFWDWDKEFDKAGIPVAAGGGSGQLDPAKEISTASQRNAGNAALEWAKNLAVNYGKGADIHSRILDAVQDLGLDGRAVDRRWQHAQDMDLRTKEGMYFLLTGTRFPGAAGYTWASEIAKVAKEVMAIPFEKAPNFDAAFREFMDYCQKVSDEYMQKEFPTLDRPVFEAMEGGRYIRVVKTSGSSRSSHLFVDKTNGDILKSAGWSAPAKHPRGNIFDKSTWKNVGPYGAAYLR